MVDRYTVETLSLRTFLQKFQLLLISWTAQVSSEFSYCTRASGSDIALDKNYLWTLRALPIPEPFIFRNPYSFCSDCPQTWSLVLQTSQIGFSDYGLPV